MYMVACIWLHVYGCMYMVACIWLHVYGCMYMVACIWLHVRVLKICINATLFKSPRLENSSRWTVLG